MPVTGLLLVPIRSLTCGCEVLPRLGIELMSFFRFSEDYNDEHDCFCSVIDTAGSSDKRVAKCDSICGSPETIASREEADYEADGASSEDSGPY